MSWSSRMGGLVMAGVVGVVSGGTTLWMTNVRAEGTVSDQSLPPPSPAQVADARELSRTFSQVASQVGPSVVRISIEKAVAMMSPFRGTPLERFFGDDGEGPSQKQQGTGSGVVIDDRGHILTNNHVVEGADRVKVSFLDGKTVDGKVVGTDPRSDLAVIKVDGVKVHPAKLGDSENMLVGEWTIAIGNPFGLDHTVTVGVLSAKNRSLLGGGRYEDFLQTDASINPGNSGGPLVNLNGEVIGINTMIAGIGTGIGFAVPTSMARPIAEQLIREGKVRRAYLGILMQDLTEELQKGLGKDAPSAGALVAQVQDDSPAQKAGIKPGDVIVGVDGTKADSSKSVQRTVLSKKIGQKLELRVWREGKERVVAVTTGELPEQRGEEMAARPNGGGGKSKLGIGLQNLTPELAERLGLPRATKGAVVSSLVPGAPAAEAGMQEGDVIVEVNGKAVQSAEEAVRALRESRPQGHMVRVRRGEGALYLVIKEP
ncbi:MAG: Do family serine endopeptidase [Myxococcota bacterium]